ncbi:MAG: hypothetical protein EA383_03405 [Spirochaetaceae bacterium]|nr:MAG: hypothetical protein EA383_03405 [Spirochaetaceae bacterium]
MNWQSIDETVWGPILTEIEDSELASSVKRVYPGTREYEAVVQLRYRGLAETGFIDTGRMKPACMRLQRDFDSVILAAFDGEVCMATLTLNTVTSHHPGLAMELEKKASIRHPHFRSRKTLEFTKFVIEPAYRNTRIGLYMYEVSAIISRMLDKPHFWQVGRDDERDVFVRSRAGFDYSGNFRFTDVSLNNMVSRIGYMHFPGVLSNGNVSRVFRRMFETVLSIPEAELCRHQLLEHTA